MLSEIEYKKLAWHSRRGMRELDLLLMPFVEGFLKDQTAEDQKLYQDFLSEEDQDLYNWLVMREPAPTANIERMVVLIRSTR
ncbi:MAG: succinate dehydrogenase assembly factor 2 [Gammaproteobacteria bacterium]